jgi:hypothetical protein
VNLAHRVFFDSSLAHRTESPDAILPSAQPECRQVSDVSDVGADLQRRSEPLTDASREEAIQLAGRLFLKHWALWEATGCFAARGDADRALMLQNRLIVGRSAEFISAREAALGLGKAESE